MALNFNIYARHTVRVAKKETKTNICSRSRQALPFVHFGTRTHTLVRTEQTALGAHAVRT